MTTGARISLPESFIVDASIAVKWFAAEADTPQARLVYKAIVEQTSRAFAPYLIVYEVANALWKSKKLQEEKVSEAAIELLNFDIQLIELDSGVIQSAAKFMVKYDLTFYDAVYAALAGIKKMPVLTANSKDFNKIKEIKVFGLK